MKHPQKKHVPEYLRYSWDVYLDSYTCSRTNYFNCVQTYCEVGSLLDAMVSTLEDDASCLTNIMKLAEFSWGREFEDDPKSVRFATATTVDKIHVMIPHG